MSPFRANQHEDRTYVLVQGVQLAGMQTRRYYT